MEETLRKKELAKLKKSNSTLRKERRKYCELFNRANDAIVLFKFSSLSEPLQVVEVNDAACRHFGYKYEELIGKTNYDIDSPETKLRGKDLVSVLLDRGYDVAEITHVNKKGESIPVEINHRMIELNGETMVISVIRNIANRKRNEQQIKESLEKERHLRERLEGEINQRVNFMRALVHELKTPLTSMLATSELLAKNLAEEPNLSYANCLYSGSQDLNMRIDELLDIARGEIGLLQVTHRPVNIEELTKEIDELMRPVFKSNNQKFTINVADSVPDVVMADFQRLKQVVVNLLDNAAKYTQCEGKISLTFNENNDNLEIEVKDNGRGMSRKEMGSLFELYSRYNKKESPSGLGIGLALSKMIIDLHGGTIKVKSKLREGSAFTFSIPLRPKIK